MKRIKYLLFVLLFGLLMAPVVMAKSNVEITGIELDSKSDNVVINNEPTFSGLEMNFDMRFLEVGDFVKYKVTVKNNIEESYTIKNEESFNESDYIKYTYEAGDTLKPNESVDVYVTITYNKELEDGKFINERYSESNKAVIVLINNETNNKENPNTSTFIQSIVLLVVSIVLIGASVLLLVHNKKIKYISVLLFILCIPFVVKAVEELKITANVNVEIIKVYKVIYQYSNVAIVTPEEKESRNDLEYCYPFYLNSISSENMYYECDEIVIYEDPTLYYSGDVVKTLPLSYYYQYADYCDIVDDVLFCTELPVIVESEFFGWEYSVRKNINYFNNDNIENDLGVLKFTCTNSDGCYMFHSGGNDNKSIIFDLDVSFVMPKRNVLITEIPPQ